MERRKLLAVPRVLQSLAWVGVYLLLVCFPLIWLIVGDVPKGGGFWWDFSMGLGFTGLAMMGLQFFLTARFRRATAPFGVDIIYYFHRWAAVGGVVLIAGHYAILRWKYAETLGPANPAKAPWHMTAGRVALVLFLVLLVSSFWRKQLRIEYDRWRIWHGIMAVAAVMLAIAHIQGVGYYTRAPGKGVIWILFSVAWLFLLAYTRVIKPWTLLRTPYRVQSVHPERGDSWTVTVEPAPGARAAAFRPGQFAWLSLGSSPFRAREHPFSFSGSAEDRSALRFTIKELGDFTRSVKLIKPGEVAYVDGPHGVFTPDLYPDASGFGLIAGGVGIAPIMSMLRTMADRRERRPLLLIYGNSNWERVLFREEIDSLAGLLNLKLVHVLQDPAPEWPGLSGILSVDLLKQSIGKEVTDFVFFLCGPKGMIHSAQRALRELGVPLRRVHYEHFEMV